MSCESAVGAEGNTYIMRTIREEETIIEFRSPVVHSVVLFLSQRRRRVGYLMCLLLVLNCEAASQPRVPSATAARNDALRIHTQPRPVCLRESP